LINGVVVQALLDDSRRALEREDLRALLSAWASWNFNAPNIHQSLTQEVVCDRIVRTEQMRAAAMAHVAVGQHLADLLGAPPYRRHAWEAFRAWRWHTDPGVGGPVVALDVVSAEEAVVEFQLVPGELMRVAIHGVDGDAYGSFVGFNLLEASEVQKGFQDDLWEHYARTRKLEDRGEILRQRGEIFLRAARRWSRLLLASIVRWDDQEPSTLGASLQELRVRRLFLVPHGPLWVVPWPLLVDDTDPRWWGERYALTLLPSSRRVEPRSSDSIVRMKLFKPVSVDGCEAAASLFQLASQYAVPRLTLHGRFRSRDPFASTLRGEGSFRQWSLRELLDAAEGAGLPERVLLHVCEAGETARYAVMADNLQLTSPFLAAGAQEVVCWWVRVTGGVEPSIAALLEPLHEALHGGATAAECVREVAAPMLARWRSVQHDEVARARLYDSLAGSEGSASLAALHDMASVNVLARRGVLSEHPRPQTSEAP